MQEWLSDCSQASSIRAVSAAGSICRPLEGTKQDCRAAAVADGMGAGSLAWTTGGVSYRSPCRQRAAGALNGAIECGAG